MYFLLYCLIFLGIKKMTLCESLFLHLNAILKVILKAPVKSVRISNTRINNFLSIGEFLQDYFLTIKENLAVPFAQNNSYLYFFSNRTLYKTYKELFCTFLENVYPLQKNISRFRNTHHLHSVYLYLHFSFNLTSLAS